MLGGAPYIMSYKDKLSLEKEKLRKQNESVKEKVAEMKGIPEEKDLV